MKKALLFIICILFSNLLSAQKNFLDVPFLETSSKVDTLVMPDKIFISIKISEADSRNKKSVEEQEQELARVLKSIGINVEKDLMLQDVGSNFKKYIFKGQNILKLKEYSLLVYDAVKVSEVLTELEKIGISNVNIDRTEYSKSEELRILLKIKAIEKTKKMADLLAKSINQTAGKAIFISDLSSGSVSNMLAGRVAGIAVRGYSDSKNSTTQPITIEFEKIKFEVEVNAKYLLN
ncbi:MAG: SIMPL domain-containing protein [Flavobacterium sp.]